MSEEDGCLRLPADLALSLPPALHASLHVRRCYKKLHRLIWEQCRKAAQPLAFTVTDTPGTGKSAFALYLIQQLGR